jgi:hypothetical protein
MKTARGVHVKEGFQWSYPYNMLRHYPEAFGLAVVEMIMAMHQEGMDPYGKLCIRQKAEPAEAVQAVSRHVIYNRDVTWCCRLQHAGPTTVHLWGTACRSDVRTT